MTKADDVPEWARKRARELLEAGDPREGYRSLAGWIETTFARYIAAHEPAPVDPLRHIVQKVACRLRQHGLYSDAQMADELERQIARLTNAGTEAEGE